MNEAKVIAALYRCDICRAWWSSREGDEPEAQLIFHMAEKHKDLFPWEDYQGWRAYDAGAAVCPGCGKKSMGPNSLSPNRDEGGGYWEVGTGNR